MSAKEGKIGVEREDEGMPRRAVRIYDLSAILLLALIVVVGWFYGGPAEEAQRRRESFARGVDNVLGGMGTPEVVAQYGGIDEDPEINARVQAIFEQVAPAAQEVRGDLRYRISVLKSDVPNAFSLPGGRTFITRGLVELLDDDDQIAGVIGHELAHTVLSHGSKAFGRDLGMILFYDYLLDRVEDHQRADAAELAHLSFALVSTGYSRAAETEADEMGLLFAVQGGYDPLGLPLALERIEEWQRQEARRTGRANNVPEFFRTHPLTENRVRHLRQMAADLGYDVYVPGDAVTEALRRYHQEATTQ